jgi:hypothetical protein
MLLTRALERQMKDEKEAERQVRIPLNHELLLNVDSLMLIHLLKIEWH